MTDQSQEDKINWPHIDLIIERFELVGPTWRETDAKTKLRWYGEVIAQDYERAAEALRALKDTYGPNTALKAQEEATGQEPVKPGEPLG
jgi:hypothetical protein